MALEDVTTLELYYQIALKSKFKELESLEAGIEFNSPEIEFFKICNRARNFGYEKLAKYYIEKYFKLRDEKIVIAEKRLNYRNYGAALSCEDYDDSFYNRFRIVGRDDE